MAIELLQKLGLNKYEAEAYYTLLAQGPLTGYELGKRSQVPLSRSYDVLERLSQRGLALVQPGEPARYKALELALFLGQARSTMEQTLTTLTRTLTTTASEQTLPGEFWVVRGRQHILERARTLSSAATRMLQMACPEPYTAELADTLATAGQRGCTVLSTVAARSSQAEILLLIDAREALLGTLEPGESCQAIVSTNPALLTVLSSYFSIQPTRIPIGAPPGEQATTLPGSPSSDWLEWESRKQQRLWKNHVDQRIA